MCRTNTHIITILLLSITLSGFAQDANVSFEVLLKSNHKLLLEQDLIDYEPNELVNGKFYRYIQFNELPNAVEQQALRYANIELLDYIPANTYLASIPANSDLSVLDALDIRAISTIDMVDKIALEIDQNHSGIQNFYLQFQKNIPADQAQCFLENNQIEIIGPYLSNNVFEVASSYSILERIASSPLLLFIEESIENPKAEDQNGNAYHRSNTLTPNFQNGSSYDGSGVQIAIGDDGMVGPHIDFSGRIEENENPITNQNAHGDMVAGILAGAGNLNPTIEGIAKGADLHILNDFEAVENAAALFEEDEVVITSTSYGDGCNRGYTTFTQLADQQTLTYPSLIHVFSAGNAGDQDCGYGAGAGWGNITGGVKVGKNVIAVGNLYTDDQLVFNSSRGPSNDGRIKPDICANGEDQLSTAPDNTFQTSSGSSAAAPIVSGILAQLYQAFRESNNNENPSSALMKAILLNTADDLGNQGPDYSYGWGRVNANRALSVLKSDNFQFGSIEHNQSLSFNLNVPESIQQVKAMLYWHDQPGSTVSSKSLVNDLDFHIQKNNEQFLPWLLNPSPDPTILDQPAITGNDRVNNVEQIVINNPVAGNYEMIIDGYQIPFGPQTFYIVYEFITEDIKLTYPFGNEKLNQGDPIRIYWDAHQGEGNFELEFSQNNGQSWSTIAIVDETLRHYDWLLPQVITNEASIRISRNGLTDSNEVPFQIYSTPTGLEINQVCPEHVSLQWNPSNGAVSYTIYALGEKYMDSIQITTSTSIDIPINSPEEEHWFAISATHENGTQSQRTIAINDGEELMACLVQHNLALVNIAYPSTNTIQSCFDQDLEIAVNIKNEGTAFQSGFQVWYQIDEQTPIVENYPGIIPSGITTNFNFQSSLDIENIGEYEIKVWTASILEQASYNDTLFFKLELIEGDVFSIPYFQNFDEFQICEETNKCKSSCELQQGWINANNYFDDAIDWKSNNGSTSTPGTGPQKDQNSNSEAGNYLYLEGSPGCFNSQATLYSPCIDLTNGIEPLLSFWYHMRGSNMGTLHVDLFNGSSWYNNIMTPISGDQGADWQKVEIDLSTFSGTLINIRFRAYTGDGFLTDLAIDNFSILETAAPPVSDFVPEKHLVCPGQIIQLFDNSYNDPTQWEWTIEPTTFNFVNGTSNNSPNPFIVFESTDLYSISLTTSNTYGADDIIKYDLIEAFDGFEIPYIENFDSPIPSVDWKIGNPDLYKTWERINILGKSGQETSAIYVNNHSYNATGQEDALTSTVIDLSNAQNPYLRFDISYAAFNQNFSDGLRIELSNDCKDSFSEVIFNQHGQTLATAPNQMTGWTPRVSDDWETVVIDLSNYIGDKIALRFINVCGFGNNLYLNNIVVYEFEDFPLANFEISPEAQSFCVGESVMFTNLSEGNNIQSFQWIFDTGVSLDTINSEGPHSITFDEVGTYEIHLRAINDLGEDQITKVIEIVDEPISDFSFDKEGNQLSFFNSSSYGESYIWDFGDGNFSTEENPIHIYQLSNITSYTVRLTVQNSCGMAVSQQTFLITTTTELEEVFEFSIAPNPTSEILHINGFTSNTKDLLFSLYDASGKIIFTKSIDNQNGKFFQRFDIQQIPSGVYFLKIVADQQISLQKVVIL